MKLIVGLGNPGKKYEHTRHNIGFLAIDFTLKNDGYIEAKPSHEFKSEMFTWSSGEKKVIFLKPQTFMNDSGLAVKIISNFYKFDISKDLLVIHDEIDLPLGQIKITESSSSAGHKGVGSIIEKLGTQDFHRIRIGIEARASRNDLPTDDFVLQNFTKEELAKLQKEILPNVQKDIQKFVAK